MSSKLDREAAAVAVVVTVTVVVGDLQQTDNEELAFHLFKSLLIGCFLWMHVSIQRIDVRILELTSVF